MHDAEGMSLLAAVLHFAGDDETAEQHEALVLVDPTEWTPERWSRAANDNDDVLIPAVEQPEFHSGDSGIGWSPRKAS